MNSLSEAAIDHEVVLRFGVFISILLAIAMWEILVPRRTLTQDKKYRWANNLGLVVLNTLILRVVFPVAAVGAAVFAQANQWGFLHWVSWIFWLECVIAILLLDMLIYGQHVMMHKVPVLWRLHRMHHVDLDFDVTTGFRFHPFEMVLSMGIKWLAIMALGAPPLAVLIFEILLSALPMFNHANARLPLAADRVLRKFIVTPDMHRVHHSVIQPETNSNYGFNLSWWDRLFGTYRDQPELGHQDMSIGLNDWRNPKDTQSVWAMLRIPFR